MPTIRFSTVLTCVCQHSYVDFLQTDSKSFLQPNVTETGRSLADVRHFSAEIKAAKMQISISFRGPLEWVSTLDLSHGRLDSVEALNFCSLVSMTSLILDNNNIKMLTDEFLKVTDKFSCDHNGFVPAPVSRVCLEFGQSEADESVTGV